MATRVRSERFGRRDLILRICHDTVTRSANDSHKKHKAAKGWGVDSLRLIDQVDPTPPRGQLFVSKACLRPPPDDLHRGVA